MPTKTPRPKPSLGVVRTNVPGVLARANIMYTAILAALAMFASPPLTMAAFLVLIQAAVAAEAAAANRTRGLATARNQKVDTLWTAMKSLKTYVGGLCDTVDAISATTMIEAAGLVISKMTPPKKLLLAATYIPATGIAHVVVNVLLLLGERPTKKTTFTFQWSADAGKSWSSITTGYAHCDIPNLPPGSYLVRVFATVGKVPGNPTDPVPFTIHA